MKFCKFPQPLHKTADAAGLNVDRDVNGEYRITSKSNRAFVASVLTEDEARDTIKDLIDHNSPDIHGNAPFPINGIPTQSRIPKPNDVLTPTREFTGALKTGIFSFLTPIKQFAETIENQGFGKAWSVIYQQSQKAKGFADQAISLTKRAALGGKTFQEAFQDIEKRVLAITDKDMRQKISLYGEAYTKTELDGMLNLSLQDKWAANQFQKLNLQHDIPLLIRRNALIDDFLDNKTKFLRNDYPTLINAIKEQRLPPELLQDIENMKAQGGHETDWREVAKTMGVTQDEEEAMNVLRIAADTKTGKQIFNVPNIYRYATAPEADPLYANGRDQFAAKHGMSSETVGIAKDRLKILDTGFSELAPKSNRELTLGVQLPVFRQFIDAGLMPGKQFANSAGAARKWAEMLTNGMPEGSDLLTRRVLSGHLNPHELDPAISLSKHIRNLTLRNTLDPIMPTMLEEAKFIGANDERFGKIMDNYLHELQGTPSEGMQNLTATIRSVGRFTGHAFDDRIADKLISTLNYLTSSASIPFRVGLIARNYYQITMGLPIIGPEAWYAGIKSALGFGEHGLTRGEAMDAAYSRAYAAQALSPDVVPLHGGDQFGEVGNMLASKVPATMGKMAYNTKEAVNWAFNKYRNADDLGRVIQFEGGRYRVNEAWKQFVQERITNPTQAMQNLKENAKVLTFNEAVEAQFEQFALKGDQVGAANLIGKELSDKVHFLYGGANHPIGWTGVAGKLLGQFGTFPVQYFNHLGEGLFRGTIKDRREFFIAHSAINMGIVAAGSSLLGVDLESWSFLPSLHYTGGPYAEMAMSVFQWWGGSDAEKSIAKRNLSMMLPWHVPSITLPTSYFFADWAKAYNTQDDLGKALATGLGFRFLQPGQKTWVDRGFGYVNEMIP